MPVKVRRRSRAEVAHQRRARGRVTERTICAGDGCEEVPVLSLPDLRSYAVDVCDLVSWRRRRGAHEYTEFVGTRQDAADVDAARPVRSVRAIATDAALSGVVRLDLDDEIADHDRLLDR